MGRGVWRFNTRGVAELHAALEREEVRVMHNAGRIRIALHGYNTREDVKRLFEVLTPLMETLKARVDLV
jgi:selenocysteine lyase/cysteine desulfurase